MVADSKIFDLIPVKKEVKAVVSGIYIMEVKGIRAPLETKEKKKGLFARAKEKVTSFGSGRKEEAPSAGSRKKGSKK